MLQRGAREDVRAGQGVAQEEETWRVALAWRGTRSPHLVGRLEAG